MSHFFGPPCVLTNQSNNNQHDQQQQTERCTKKTELTEYCSRNSSGRP